MDNVAADEANLEAKIEKRKVKDSNEIFKRWKEFLVSFYLQTSKFEKFTKNNLNLLIKDRKMN